MAAKLGDQDRLMLLYGGMDDEHRESIKAAFQTDPDKSLVRILLATDAASEGIDLQLHCHRLVHYEIPWNPSRMEQRNGRIDRHGQKHTPLIYHFAPQGFTGGERLLGLDVHQLDGAIEFLARVAQKVEHIRQDLGRVGPVIAGQIDEAMLGNRDKLDTSVAELESGPVREMLRIERDMAAQIEAFHTKLLDTRQTLDLTPENVLDAVQVALELAGQPPLVEAELEDVWPDPTGRTTRCPVYELPALGGSWALCSQGLAHPHTGELRPIVFDHNLVRGRDDVVLAHLNHRLVQMSLRLLRAEVWNTESRQGLYRVAARIVPDSVLDTPAVVAHGRLVVVGGNRTRLHEEIISAGGVIREGRFRRMNVSEVKNALAAQTDREPSQGVKEGLTAVWSAVEASLAQSLQVRMENLVNGLTSSLDRRRENEREDIRAILAELEDMIQHELEGVGPVQLPLFSANEREQYNTNVNALRARLDQIPGELQAELEVIDDRYADPQPRLFPVAVTFLVPERLDRGR